jgi:hypothetical protein
MPRFEIAVYNQEVATIVERGERHRRYGDGWAETRYIEINAPSLNEAHLRAQSRYPTSAGFVVQSVTLLEQD